MIKHAQYIRESIKKLAGLKKRLFYNHSDWIVEIVALTPSILMSQTTRNPVVKQLNLVLLIWYNLLKIVSSTSYFEIFHRVGNAATTEELMSKVEELNIASNEKKKLKISHEAFLAEEDVNAVHKQRQADQMNGLIVTESESDDPGAIQDATSVMDESIREIVIKKRNSIKRQQELRGLLNRISCRKKQKKESEHYFKSISRHWKNN